MKKLITVAAFFTAITLAYCGAEQPLRLLLSAKKSHFKTNEPIAISVVVSNTGDDAVTVPIVVMGSGLTFVVASASGRQISMQSDGHGQVFSGPSSLSI